MYKIGEFIYPWGSGHFSRMMRLNEVLSDFIKEEYTIHYSSKDHVYEKLLAKFPDQSDNIHEILMPTPIDGKFGPDVYLSFLNLFLPIAGQKPVVKQIADYLRKEAKLYNKEKFDVVINDGDMGSNILAYNRDIPSLFVTNQYKPKLWGAMTVLTPGLNFVAKQISKASRILVADSEPPYTMCEYNLNFSGDIKKKVTYVGHFTSGKLIQKEVKTDLEKLIEENDFGYWVRTGNRSTNDGTGIRYEQIFHQEEMKNEKRIISHAKNDSSIDCVLGRGGKKYSIPDALEKKVDWIQIDIGYLSEQQKDTVLDLCKYAVINGSHTIMGEVLGGKSKPIIGYPIYDEHKNQIMWAQDRNLGFLATNTKQAIQAIEKLKINYNKLEESLDDFSRNFNKDGTRNAAKIVAETLENKK